MTVSVTLSKMENDRRPAKFAALSPARTPKFLLAGLALVVAALAQVGNGAQADNSCCGAITRAGHSLERVLDGMQVESRWLAQEHINWETGLPDKGADYDGPGRATHCSAFAAAVAKKLGIYMLRPPDHGQVLLANAQAAWFHTASGRSAGWRAVPGPKEAQTLANQGSLVVIVFESPDPHKPGHIAIVHPDLRPLRLLEESGPTITQAGQTNYTRNSARVGFEHHAGAWPNGVRYYAHVAEN